MQLVSLQQKAVDQILDLYNSTQKVICEFKAPTGSGKTLMASSFISNLIDRFENEKFLFVIATPSSSSLPLFFEQKINKYKVDLPYSKFEVEYIQSPSSAKNDKTEAIKKIIPEQNKVFIFGKSSFGSKRIFSEYGIIEDFIKFAVEQNFKIIYIRDEAHIGGDSIDKKSNENFESLLNKYAHFILKMTATPDFSNPNTQKVILREKDLNNELLNEGCYLLKTTAQPILDSNLDDTKVLSTAIKKFKQIKKDYADLNISINPAMLIQVDNSSSEKEKKAEFEKSLTDIKNTLKKSGLSWVQYFGDNDKDSNRINKDKFTLDEITQNNNDIDVVIFKIGPATGWDIPRACMLVQLRNVSSKNLNTQTIGRIKRNPYPGLIKNEITDKYYVLSNIKNNDDEVKLYHYKVRKNFTEETFLKIDITNKEQLSKAKNTKFKSAYKEFLEQNKHTLKQEINSAFVNGCTYKKVVMKTTEGKLITSTITNPFVFLRNYKRLITANKYFYEQIQEETEKFSAKEKLHSEFLFTVLLENHKNEIRNLLHKTRNIKPQFEITESSYDPKDYTEVYNGNSGERINRDYLFEIQSTGENSKNRQPLDSNPEKFVFNKIYDFAEEEQQIKLWAKNQTTSNIYGNYLDDSNKVMRSFFDFIIKFNNGFYLYLEVKGKKDIDENKTALLEKAYKAYFTEGQRNLFTPRLAIAVCRVGDSGEISLSTFYDKDDMGENLKDLPLDILLKTVSEMPFDSVI